ncbi:MAG: CGNR zinc finger domain-containing protein [Rhodoglobus sp.]
MLESESSAPATPSTAAAPTAASTAAPVAAHDAGRPSANGQWFTSDTSRPWWFDSGARALDFAYTGAMGGNPAGEQLHSPAELSTWLAARFEEFDGTLSDRDLTDARGLRAAIATIASALSINELADPHQIDVINLFAATPDVPPQLAGGGMKAGRTSVRCGQAFSTMAREAVTLFSSQQHERIRQCAADDCALVFFDESRSNNRRWCSMQRCGNRAKVRSHRARTATR